DVMGRRLDAEAPNEVDESRAQRRARQREVARRVSAVGGVASVVTAGLAATAGVQHLVSPKRVWARRKHRRDLGTGPLALLLAIFGWDFIYYFSHRLQHESRAMWAIHVVHHSSERYNL